MGLFVKHEHKLAILTPKTLRTAGLVLNLRFGMSAGMVSLVPIAEKVWCGGASVYIEKAGPGCATGVVVALAQGKSPN